MKALQHEFDLVSNATSARSNKANQKQPTHKTTRSCPRVTLRLSVEDHARLKELAGSTALATYIRAQVLGNTLPKRRPRSTASVADKQALAQILGLLGQSKIANNLNQLAYHANVGSLAVDDETKAQIHEIYDHVLLIRTTLINALGLRE